MKNLSPLKEQSVAQSIRENFQAYPDSYPTSGDGPSDEGINSLVSWVENEFENTESDEKGSIEEWFEIAITQYINYFNFQDGDFDEAGETESYIREQILFIKSQ